MIITRILVVLNKLSDSSEVLSKGFEFAKKFNAKVEVLFVYEKPLFDISELFSDESVDKDAIKAKLQEEVKQFSSDDVAILVKIDDTASRVWDLLRDDKKSLVVAKYNDNAIDIANKNKSAIYIIKNNQEQKKAALVFEEIEKIKRCINATKEFNSNLELIYNYMFINYSDPIDPALSGFGVDNEILLQTQEEIFEDLKKEHNLDGNIFVNGIGEGKSIAEYINEQEFTLVSFCNIEDFIGGSIFEDIAQDIVCDILKL